MIRNRNEPGVPLSLRFIADGEQRIVRQKQIVAELKRKGRPTHQAEAELRKHQHALAMLRNHSDIMQELMKPDPQQKRCSTVAS